MKQGYIPIIILLCYMVNLGCYEKIAEEEIQKNGLYGPVKSYTQEVFIPLYKNEKIEELVKDDRSSKGGNLKKIYNQSGNLTEYHLFNKNDDQIERTIYYYNNENNLLEEHYWDPRQQYSLKYEYDPSNNNTGIIKFSKNNELISKKIFDYDESKNVIAEFEISNNQDTVVSRRLEYNSENQLYKETVFRKNGLSTIVINYIRNDLGLVEEENRYNIQGDILVKTQYKYDKYKNIVEELVFLPQHSRFINTRKVKMIYEFDKAGNWVKSSEHDKEFHINEIIRNFEYYK